MRYLLISNKGLLETDALSLLGASTKRFDNDKIGQFGSGNKYALSYFLRNNISVRIFSGINEVNIGIKHKVFRNQDFNVITINGNETSMTTDFGYEWKLWEAIRELYSNAIDEGLTYFGVINTDTIEGVDENTRIYIECTSEVDDFMLNIDDYLALKLKPIFENNGDKIYNKHSSSCCIYYRGIRCLDTNLKSLFDYDFHDIKINESRTVKYSWSVGEHMWDLLFKCKDVNIISIILSNIHNKEYIENNIDSSMVSIPSMYNQQTWINAVGNNLICPTNLSGYVEDDERPVTYFLPGRLYDVLIKFLGEIHKPRALKLTSDGTIYKKVHLDALMRADLNKALDFFKECNSPIEYAIEVVSFENDLIMGKAENDTILLSEKVFNRGVHRVASVLLEEQLHLKTGEYDLTRAFQNEIFDFVINYMKKANAIAL